MLGGNKIAWWIEEPGSAQNLFLPLLPWPTKAPIGQRGSAKTVMAMAEL